MKEKADPRTGLGQAGGQAKPGEKVTWHQPVYCEGASHAEAGRKNVLGPVNSSGRPEAAAEGGG